MRAHAQAQFSFHGDDIRNDVVAIMQPDVPQMPQSPFLAAF
jgi:hypothetical protein